MQRTLIASVIIMSLSACDGKSLAISTDGSNEVTETSTDATRDADGNITSETITAETPTPVVVQPTPTTPISDDAASGSSDGGETTPVIVVSNPTTTPVNEGTVSDGGDKYDDTTTSDDTTDADGDKFDTDKPVTETPVSDDAGSSSSDGGETVTPTTDDTDTVISDDAGSSSSDGGQIPDDAASGSSDGGEIADDAASGSSDGGEIADDAASGSSDGGEIADDAASGSSDGGDTVSTPVVTTPAGPVDTDAGEFSSGTGGNTIRVSSLSSGSSVNVCTTASNQNNFSDTRVGDFILHNNAWRPWRAQEGYEWSQCIYTNNNGALAGWNYDWGNGRTGVNGSPNPSGDFYVRSYPELIYGVKDEYRTSAAQSVTGLPVFVRDMPTFRIDYSYDGPEYGESRTVDASNNSSFPNGTTISGERNVAIESFFYEPNAAGQCTTDIVTRDGGTNHVYEVMVWLDAGAERLPAGPSDFVANLTIRGEAFKVYTKGADNRYIAFVAQNPQTTGTLYWNDFTDWARANAHLVRERFGARSNSVQIQDDWCMANIIVGTEIFWGAGELNIYDWTITQSE